MGQLAAKAKDIINAQWAMGKMCLAMLIDNGR
jgi:hypothetical protein